MSKSVAQLMLQRLRGWGVARIYGYPGDGINGLLGAFHTVPELDFIQVRHEEMAAFNATAHAKLTGEPGVCMAASGPGAIHLLNGLYDAKLDHQPVVAIVGQQARVSRGNAYQQELDLPALFKDVASELVQVCTEPAQAGHLVDRAMRIARATRSPTCLIVPSDVQEAEYSESRNGERAAVNPPRVFHELSSRLPDNCILTGDSSSATNWWVRHLKLRSGMKAILPGTPATMGAAIPYAIGAKFTFPDRPVIAVVGDGAMQRNGLNELITIQHYRARWADETLIVLVLNNPKPESSQRLPFPYAEYAEMLGMTGIRVTDPDHLGEAWDEILGSGSPGVLEVLTDPGVSPLPPHIRLEQAEGLAPAAVEDDPAAPEIARHALREKLAEIVQR